MSDEAKRKRDADHQWHRAINEFTRDKGKIGADDWPKFMYAAKDASCEVERLQRLFKATREGTLPLIHKQCSLSEEVALEKNELGCYLGVRCNECPFLQALDRIEGTDEDRDRAKAWTCTTHILMSGGDPAGEGFILTDDDVLYWQTLYRNMAGSDPEDIPPASAPEGGK